MICVGLEGCVTRLGSGAEVNPIAQHRFRDHRLMSLTQLHVQIQW